MILGKTTLGSKFYQVVMLLGRWLRCVEMIDISAGGFEKAANLVDKYSRNPHEQWNIGNSKAGTNSSQHEVVITIKSAEVVQQFASYAVR